jgi:hypothetical protein
MPSLVVNALFEFLPFSPSLLLFTSSVSQFLSQFTLALICHSSLYLFSSLLFSCLFLSFSVFFLSFFCLFLSCLLAFSSSCSSTLNTLAPPKKIITNPKTHTQQNPSCSGLSERWYGTKYGESPFSAEQLGTWGEALAGRSATWGGSRAIEEGKEAKEVSLSGAGCLALPQPNPFVPTDFEIRAVPADRHHLFLNNNPDASPNSKQRDEEEDKKAGCFSRPVLLLREEDDSDSPSAMLSDPRYQGRKI